MIQYISQYHTICDMSDSDKYAWEYQKETIEEFNANQEFDVLVAQNFLFATHLAGKKKKKKEEEEEV